MSEHLKVKKRNAFVAMFIPNKDDSKSGIIRKIVVLLAFAVAIVCFVFVLTNFSQQNADKNMNVEIREKVELNASGSFSIDRQKVEEIKKEQPRIMDKFVDLYAQNSDLVGWIKVGHYIDYPVLMRKDDLDFYLSHNFNKEDSVSGSIFIDNHIQPFTDANNLVVYGHNMSSGEYFSTLNYYNPYSSVKAGVPDYYKKYPTFSLDTLYEESTYKIFAAIYINVDEKNGYPYPYHAKRQFKNETEFMDFMGNIMDRSVFYTGVDVEYGDQIVTLSTCFWLPFSREQLDGRFAVFARKVRDGESPEVDTSKFTLNSDPLMFDLYYRTFGGSWGGRKWDLSLIKDFDKYSDKIDSLDEIEPEDTGTAEAEIAPPM